MKSNELDYSELIDLLKAKNRKYSEELDKFSENHSTMYCTVTVNGKDFHFDQDGGSQLYF